MFAGESPGSIRNQIGRSLNSIRECVENGDVNGVADHLALLVAIAAPKLLPDEVQRFSVPEMEAGRDRDGMKAHRLFRQCMGILSELLCALSDRGLYAYKEAEVGDASGLALRADEPEEEAAA